MPGSGANININLTPGTHRIGDFGTVVLERMGQTRVKLTAINVTDTQEFRRGWINNPHNAAHSNQPATGNLASILECLREYELVQLNAKTTSNTRLLSFLIGGNPGFVNNSEKRISQMLINNLRNSR